jgi:hypothetical protein
MKELPDGVNMFNLDLGCDHARGQILAVYSGLVQSQCLPTVLTGSGLFLKPRCTFQQMNLLPIDAWTQLCLHPA